MRRFYRILKRKENVRRMLSAAFLLIAFIEIGSHAFTDSYDIDHFQTLGFCGIQHDAPITVDVPTKQKQRGPESNLFDEMTTHTMILSSMSIPFSGSMYQTDPIAEDIARLLSGTVSKSFHPPKQA